MGVFHIFKIVQMVPNCATHHISEIYFHSIILDGDGSFHLNGYNIITADHPINTKRGGIYIYHKESLSVHEVKLSNLSYCVICEVSQRNSKGYIGVV